MILEESGRTVWRNFGTQWDGIHRSYENFNYFLYLHYGYSLFVISSTFKIEVTNLMIPVLP